jgi:hypothetical protein
VISYGKYYLPLFLDLNLILCCHRISLTPYRSYAQSYYLFLYNILCHLDICYFLNENTANSVVYNLTVKMREAINLAIPYIRSKHSTFPRWFCSSLIYFIKEKN